MKSTWLKRREARLCALRHLREAIPVRDAADDRHDDEEQAGQVVLDFGHEVITSPVQGELRFLACQHYIRARPVRVAENEAAYVAGEVAVRGAKGVRHHLVRSAP